MSLSFTEIGKAYGLPGFKVTNLGNPSWKSSIFQIMTGPVGVHAAATGKV